MTASHTGQAEAHQEPKHLCCSVLRLPCWGRCPVQDFGFSPEGSFVTAPPTGPGSSVKLLAIADMGQADIDGSNEAMQYWPSRNTTNLMQRDMDGRRLVLHLGDISYAR